MVPIKTRYTTSESQSMLYIFKKKSWKKPRRHCLSWQPFSATFTFCCFGSIRQFMSFKDVSALFPSWGWEFWWLTSRETWPPVVWPQEMGWHWRGWQPSITDGAMGPATVCSPAFLSAPSISCFLKSNTHLYLACPLHILQHGQSQQRLMALVWDITVHGCCMKSCPWQRTATALLFLCCCKWHVAASDQSDKQPKKNDKWKSAVGNKSAHSGNYVAISLKKKVSNLKPKIFHQPSHIARLALVSATHNIPWKWRNSLWHIWLNSLILIFVFATSHIPSLGNHLTIQRIAV